MPVTVEEKFGRRLGETQAEVVYLILGTHDQAEARSDLAAVAPTTYQGLKRSDVEVTEIDGVAGGAFFGAVRYARNSNSPPQVGESSFSFETGGGMTHVVASLATVGAYGTGAATADNGKLINATSEGVEGVDIVSPVYQWSETHWLDPSDVTATYKGHLYSLTGRTNNASFKNTNIGETLFLGASGSQRGDDPWEIAFNFASAPNITGASIGGITGISKGGWEYLWVRYKPKELTGDLKLVTQQPAAVYVERMYESGNFALLGIGT